MQQGGTEELYDTAPAVQIPQPGGMHRDKVQQSPPEGPQHPSVDGVHYHHIAPDFWAELRRETDKLLLL